MNRLQHIRTIAVCAAIVSIIVFAWWMVRAFSQTEVSVTVDDEIDITPEQIEHIKSIGEWEFLSVSDEVMADTMRRGIISDDHLVRIYYGTLRLGINMHDVEPGWLRAAGDSIILTLPPVRLLDKDFIDEARTKNFYESGRWTAATREALYQKAYRMMLAHGMTRQNMESARSNGEHQFRSMLRALGFSHVRIRWGE